MHLLDDVPVGVGDEEPDARVGAEQRAHGRRGQLRRPVVRVALAPVLEPDREHEELSRLAAGAGEPAHLRPRRVQAVEGRVAADRGRPAATASASVPSQPGRPGCTAGTGRSRGSRLAVS